MPKMPTTWAASHHQLVDLFVSGHAENIEGKHDRNLLVSPHVCEPLPAHGVRAFRAGKGKIKVPTANTRKHARRSV